jgi:cytochrome b561
MSCADAMLPIQLSKYPVLSNVEKQTSVPKTYAVIGLVALYFFAIIFNLGGQFLTNLAGFAIPAYYSLEALFTSSSTDDTQWLTVSPACASRYQLRTPFANTIYAAVLGRLRLLHVCYSYPR